MLRLHCYCMLTRLVIFLFFFSLLELCFLICCYLFLIIDSLQPIIFIPSWVLPLDAARLLFYFFFCPFLYINCLKIPVDFLSLNMNEETQRQSVFVFLFRFSSLYINKAGEKNATSSVPACFFTRTSLTEVWYNSERSKRNKINY